MSNEIDCGRSTFNPSGQRNPSHSTTGYTATAYASSYPEYTPWSLRPLPRTLQHLGNILGEGVIWNLPKISFTPSDLTSSQSARTIASPTYY
jgi:hypothetical protein